MDVKSPEISKLKSPGLFYALIYVVHDLYLVTYDFILVSVCVVWAFLELILHESGEVILVHVYVTDIFIHIFIVIQIRTCIT